MESIFPKSSASTKLPLNPDNWDAKIVMILTAEYPTLLTNIESVEYTNVDRESGTATGFVLLKNAVRIPLLINRFEMSPMDIFVSKDGTYGYLTPETVRWIIGSEWPFKSISMRELSALKVPNIAPINIIKQASNEERMEMALGLSKLGHGELLESFRKEAEDTSGIYEFTTCTHDPIYPIRRNDGERYSLEKFAEEAGEEVLSNLLSSGKCIAVSPSSMYKIATAVAVTRDDLNLKHEGHVFAIHYLEDDRPVGKSVVITRDGKYSYAKPEEVKGGDISYSPVKPSVGDKVLLLRDSASAYGPFILESIGSVNGEKRILVTGENLPSLLHISFVDGVKAPTKLAPGKFAVPSYWSLTKLGDPLLVKQAEEGMVANITLKKKGQMFSISHIGVLPDNIKSGQIIDMDKASAALVYLGVDEDVARKMLEEMHDGEERTFSVAKTPLEKEAEDIPLDDRIEKIRGEAVELMKVAEKIIPESQTIDTILGLGLITKTSIAQYKTYIPSIKNTINDLCKVLIAKRVNPTKVEIPELELIITIRGLTNIMADIRRL